MDRESAFEDWAGVDVGESLGDAVCCQWRGGGNFDAGFSGFDIGRFDWQREIFFNKFFDIFEFGSEDFMIVAAEGVAGDAAVVWFKRFLIVIIIYS